MMNDLSIGVTNFKNVYDKSAGEFARLSWSEFIQHLSVPPVFEVKRDSDRAEIKKQMPLIRLAEYNGDERKEEDISCLYGLETDYDGGEMSIETASQLLSDAKIKAVLYTSPNHSENNPRWRVVLPFSEPQAREKRVEYVEKLNGILNGVLAPESSTAFGFFHGVYADRKDQFKCLVTEGKTIDTLELPRRPIARVNKSDQDTAPPAHLSAIEALMTGEDLHANALRFVASLVHQGKSIEQVYSTMEMFKPKLIEKRGQQRVEEFYKGELKRLIEGAFEKGFDPASSAANDFAELRKLQQRYETQYIGEGLDRIPFTHMFSLEDALKRFCFLTEGSRVVDMQNPRREMSLEEFRITNSGNQTIVSLPDGTVKKLSTVQQWLTSPKRMTVDSKTFRAGADVVTLNPAGVMSVNTWSPRSREGFMDEALVQPFLEHIEYLFPLQEQRESFLNWLAHLEQRPEILPHISWVHIADHFGTGRGWLSAVLARIWAGEVATAFDLSGMLNSGFNGQLSRKVLAIVDEIQEGGTDTWRHSERLKSLITETERTINPKYGRQTVEWNCCRWLLFSNHLSAIPLESGDRRFEVAHLSAKPKDEQYYIRLYELLDAEGFIQSVALWLKKRNISQYNPCRPASLSHAKSLLIDASKSNTKMQAESLIKHWPSDLIGLSDLISVLTEDFNGSFNSHMRKVCEQLGIRLVSQSKFNVYSKRTKLYAVRNANWWATEALLSQKLVDLEMAKLPHREFGQTANDVLDGLMSAE